MSRSRIPPLLAHLLLGALLLPATVSAAPPPVPLEVIYPRPISSADPRPRYPIELLRLALEKAEVPYTLRPTELVMPQDRALAMAARGELVRVVWTEATRERMTKLRAIPVPLEKGLVGWRVFLIRAADQPRFAAIRSVAELAELTAGQGHDWPDVHILRDAGLEVFASPSYDGLFRMLAHGRVDYLPRGVFEVWPELEARPGLGLAVERSLVLQYPTAFYFFVNPADDALAEALTLGLQRARADGSFEALFQRYLGPEIARVKPWTRRILRITNPLLDPEHLPDDPALWYQAEPPADPIR